MTSSSLMSAILAGYKQGPMMEIWAHRGLITEVYKNNRRHPGNTIFDFKKAYDCGVHGIEADVVLNKDGEIIIYHPKSLKPDPIDLPWSEAKKIHPDLIRIGTLLNFLKDRPDLQCCFDLKQNSDSLAKKVAEMVICSGLEKRSFLTAFQKRKPLLGLETDGEILINVKKHYPNIQTHLIASFPFDLPNLADTYQPDMISFGWLDDSVISKLFFNLAIKPWVNLREDIDYLHNEKGVRVLAGITSNINAMFYFDRLGVDAIMTENAIMAFVYNIAKKRNKKTA